MAGALLVNPETCADSLKTLAATGICYHRHPADSALPTLSTPAQLADFLASAERRAFKHAAYAVRDR